MTLKDVERDSNIIFDLMKEKDEHHVGNVFINCLGMFVAISDVKNLDEALSYVFEAVKLVALKNMEIIKSHKNKRIH